MYWLLVLHLIGAALAHSWNEQLSVIIDGEYSGQNGYPRGYVSHLLCSPSQRTSNQAEGYPRLRVSPGSYIAMKYLENGKPAGRGKVHVFGTDEPDAQEVLTRVLEWTADGLGGDGRGKLLTIQDFDDGRCYQINGGSISLERQTRYPNPVPGIPNSINEQWCETNVMVPEDLLHGSMYTLYWVWQWPTSPGSPGLPEGKDEYYTTCSDVDIVPYIDQRSSEICYRKLS
ncbi:hypothetical protein B0I35DRAFT_454703 [Stachybotrys elegans]|uniref:DUF7492 domain-containing protein n=1 Tax=Stachybotrys elegans TaxID=80388 RepID=A0A8K0WJK3_9HYPO|nr:hypothetical protein B0I35DRAFT_454703 [Stachybotrys elegans]